MANTQTEQKPNAPKYLGCLTCSVSGLSGLSEVFLVQGDSLVRHNHKKLISQAGTGGERAEEMVKKNICRPWRLEEKRKSSFTEKEKINCWKKAKNVRKGGLKK